MFYINNKYKYKINNNKIYFILFLLFYYVNCNKITNNNDDNDYNLINLIKRSTVIISGFGIKNICTSYNNNINNNCNSSYNKNINNNFVIINLLPKTVYKGNELVRKLELYRESQYFIYRGQLNATLLYKQEDGESIHQQTSPHEKLPYANERENFQINDNNSTSTTTSILDLLPRQLIIFGTLNLYNKLNTSTQIIINRNGLREWSQNIENKIWKFLGWSEWSKFTPCSVSCGKGVQQRYRYCFNSVNSNILNGKLAKTTITPPPSSSSSSAPQATKQMKLQSNKTMEYQQQHSKKRTFTSIDDNYSNDCSIEGYNIEQRNCNVFKCTGMGMVDFLLNFNASLNAAFSSTTSTPSITSPSISSTSTTSTSSSSTVATFEIDNNKINKQNFTIMMVVNLKNFTKQNTNNLLTIRSDNDSEVGVATQSLSVEFIENQFQLLHEKFNYAEKFEIKSGIIPYLNDDHYLSISIANGNVITNYYNCMWENTYVLSKNFIRLNNFLLININVNLIEHNIIKQLIIINNNNNRNEIKNDVSTRQCSNDISYIRDDEIFIKSKNFY